MPHVRSWTGSRLLVCLLRRSCLALVDTTFLIHLRTTPAATGLPHLRLDSTPRWDCHTVPIHAYLDTPPADPAFLHAHAFTYHVRDYTVVHRTSPRCYSHAFSTRPSPRLSATFHHGSVVTTVAFYVPFSFFTCSGFLTCGYLRSHLPDGTGFYAAVAYASHRSHPAHPTWTVRSTRSRS